MNKTRRTNIETVILGVGLMALFVAAAIAPCAHGSEINQTQVQKPRILVSSPTKPSLTGHSQSKTPSVSASSNQQQQQQQAQIQSSNQSTYAAGGDASAGASANSLSEAGASNSYTDNSVSESSFRDARQTPPAFAGNVQPTINCANARNGGASSPVVGLSFGVSTKNEECDLRETAREFFEMGQEETAVALLCHSAAARKYLPSCGYQKPEKAGTSPKDEYPPGERERRIHQHHAEDLQK